MSTTDKAKAKVEELKGKAKQKLGDTADNDKVTNSGKADELKGKAKQKVEDVEDVFK